MMLMKRMIFVSLLINILVLIPVCAGLFFDADWVVDGYGPVSPARGILLSIYGAILVTSFCLLIKPLPLLVAPLLLVQVLYKLTTPFTVGNINNPVVISNLAIAAVHLVTLFLILRVIQFSPSNKSPSSGNKSHRLI
jgi:hypothetical protein